VVSIYTGAFGVKEGQTVVSIYTGAFGVKRVRQWLVYIPERLV
jgi:hypothetical protein